MVITSDGYETADCGEKGKLRLIPAKLFSRKEVCDVARHYFLRKR